MGLSHVDCNKCIHLETDVCIDCSIYNRFDDSCSCHINPPCSMCENCKFEES